MTAVFATAGYVTFERQIDVVLAMMARPARRTVSIGSPQGTRMTRHGVTMVR